MVVLVVILAAIAARLVVFGVMDLRARRRGVRYRVDEAREQPNMFDTDIAGCAATSRTARARGSRDPRVEVADGPVDPA